MKKKSSIVYINFAPYDNAGRILDYLIDNFYIVLHFSYDHLRLKKGRRSKLTLYKNGKIILNKDLIWLRTHPILLFPSLPFVALAIATQTFFYVYRYKERYVKFNYFLSVNAYTAWLGNLLRFTGLIDKTIYWVWDYFPINYPDIRLRLARWGYWKFDKPSRYYSDEVIFLNKHLESVRKEKNGLSKKKYPIIPIGTNPSGSIRTNNKIIIGHMGMLKKSQGLDLLFDNIETLIKIYPTLKIEIIGSGPEENHFRKRAEKFTKFVKFYGYIQKDDDVDKIISSWTIGIATYVPLEWSEHYWTDPSKIKAYLNQGIPVIATNVPEFAKELERNDAGIIVDYYKNQEFINAVKNIINKRNCFANNALKLAKKYDYRNLYPKLFN